MNDSLGGQGGEGDTAACGTTLSAVLVQGPDEGTLSLNADGSFTFSKETEGGVTFTYKACDDAGFCSTVATVNVYVPRALAQVRFVQERGRFVQGDNVSPSSDAWTQPAGYGTGALYPGSGAGPADRDGPYSWATPWVSPDAWANSWVEATNPGGMGVCNTNANPQPPWLDQSGALTAWLKGSPGSTYSVDVSVTIFLSQVGNTVNVNGDAVYAVKAHVEDYTWSGNPPANCGHSSEVHMPDVANGSYTDRWTCNVTAATQDKLNADGTTVTVKKGEAKIVAIVPTFGARATAAWTADFWGVIEIHSAT